MTIYSRNVFTGVPIEYLVDPKKKYIFVSDFFESDLKGGAELTTEAFIRECLEPDLVAKVHSANLTVEFLENNIRKGMHLILGNFTQVPEEALGWLVEGTLTTDYVSYSVIEYDFKLCCYRSLKAHFMQTQQKCNCYNESHGKMIEALYKYAKHLFWMSEKQQTLFHKYLPELAKDTRNQTVLGSAFTPDDLDFIQDIRNGLGGRSIDKTAILGSGSWIKGITETEQLLSQQGVAYVKLPALEHKKFLMELGKYKRFCFKPLDWDTCPRVVMEAKLLGLDLDLNENVLMQEDSWWKNKTIEELEEYLYNVNKQLFWKKMTTNEETTVAA